VGALLTIIGSYSARHIHEKAISASILWRGSVRTITLSESSKFVVFLGPRRITPEGWSEIQQKPLEIGPIDRPDESP
jgi:hypothetical protein